LISRDDEEKLLHSLAALVPLATEGIVADVVLAELGSRGTTAAIADAAGCSVIEGCTDIDTAVSRAVEATRKAWLLALLSGDAPDREVATAAQRHVALMNRAGPKAAAFLSLTERSDSTHRALLSLAFDTVGFAAPHRRRILAPRGEAMRLIESGRFWRGARLKARISRGR
jgi:hypothetical protein